MLLENGVGGVSDRPLSSLINITDGINVIDVKEDPVIYSLRQDGANVYTFLILIDGEDRSLNIKVCYRTLALLLAPLFT